MSVSRLPELRSRTGRGWVPALALGASSLLLFTGRAAATAANDSALGALDAKELILLLVAAVGLAAVLAQYSEETKWFTYGYVALTIGAVATNAEALLLGDLLNLVERGVGIMAAGVVFCVAAYLRRKRVIVEGGAGGSDTSDGANGAEASDADGSAGPGPARPTRGSARPPPRT